MMKLTELQQRVFDVLDKRPNTDVTIAELFNAAYPMTAEETLVPRSEKQRWMQQKLGPLLSRINSKLKRGRIEPGQLKQTYRLNTKYKV